MKRLATILSLLLAFTAATRAMSYEQARDQALFLTDKMAYELNLTEAQYDAAYEVNLDYLMSINSPDDLYSAYWRQRSCTGQPECGISPYTPAIRAAIIFISAGRTCT